ncbi:MAG: undecaprenyl-diphosphate phosphatase [Syntrophobacteraceae bacterium]
MPRKLFVVVVVTLALAAVAAGVPGMVGAEDSSAKSRPEGAMTLWQAVVLGAVEGLTEYLPVSSTGHLLVAEEFMGLDKSDSGGDEDARKEASDAYAICIQAGAILAVLGLYRDRVRQMLHGVFGKDPTGLRIAVAIVAAFVPAAVIGLLFDKAIKAHLFGIWPVAAAWFVGGLAILGFTWWRDRDQERGRGYKSLEHINIRMSLVIGFMQCIAMWPGVSRSLVTIVGGLLVGLSLASAVEFSFLLGLVTLGAATSYDALKHGKLMLQMFDALPLIVGLVAAFIFAVISVKWMVSYLNRHSLAIFGYYRVLAAVLVSAWMLF